MKDTEGLSLREAWKQKGTSECLHPALSTERSFSGVLTGAYLCTTCGHLMSMERVPHEVAPRQASETAQCKARKRGGVTEAPMQARSIHRDDEV